jgi:3-phenylpropionate/cinnamic acid dioxygenase small subunit
MAQRNESAYVAITRLVYTYAERLDAGDLTGMAALFEHATFRSESPAGISTLTGSREVHDGFAGSVRRDDGTPATKHVTTNLIVEESDDGGRASARSVFTVLQAKPALPLQVILAGSYRDEFVRTGEGWRFADRLVRIELVGDLREHLMVEIDGGRGPKRP